MRSLFLPVVNAAQEVRPMNGGIVQASTEIFTSLRGWVTLKVASFSLYLPFRPVISSILTVSTFGAAAKAPGSIKKRPIPTTVSCLFIELPYSCYKQIAQYSDVSLIQL